MRRLLSPLLSMARLVDCAPGIAAVQRRGQGRGRTADLPLFRRTLVPTELPDQDWRQALGGEFLAPYLAVLTGFEPATSTLTGWRALRAALQDQAIVMHQRAPNGIRTRAAALKGRCPRPLDDGGSTDSAVLPVAPAVGDHASIGDERHCRQSDRPNPLSRHANRCSGASAIPTGNLPRIG
jgi:hypothetical protein